MTVAARDPPRLRPEESRKGYVIGEEGEAAPYTHVDEAAFTGALSDPETGLLDQAERLRRAVVQAIAEAASN